jgi:glycosyltransferase involved in cell wall biosynthesis
LRVSVLIPTYNRRTQVLRAIASVLAQTLPADEIIVVDDGSTDATAEAISGRYGSRVTLIQQENKGVSAARTRAVEEARGEWVAFLDSDDVWLPTKLERQFDGLATMGNDFGACFTNCSYFGNPDLRLSAFEEAGLQTVAAVDRLDDPAKYIVGRYFGIYVQSLLVRRSLVTELGCFDDALGISEDRDLIFRLTFRTKFCFVSAPLVKIDRTLCLPRLTGLPGHKPDQSDAFLEYMLKKWYAWPELVDSEVRQMIQKELISLYYGGVAERLDDLKLAAALQNISKIRCMGQSHKKIFVTLLSRAAKKASRTLRGWSGGH